MPLESGCLAYAAFANLALARPRYRDLAAEHLSPAVRRVIAVALLTLSLALSIDRFGAAQGVVTWVGIISLAALALVLMMSRWPAPALKTWLVVGLSSALFLLV